MSLNRLFEDDSGFFRNIMDLIAKRSFNIEYVCGLVGWTRIFELFSPLPPKLRIFSVDYYRSFEAQKMVFGPALDLFMIRFYMWLIQSYFNVLLLFVFNSYCIT